MAKSQAVAKLALRKLEDQLSCAICLDAFKDPKLLQCFHVYCKDCLQRLVVTGREGQLSLQCPTCRQTTLLPQATGVSGLQPAFYIHHLMEIQSALEKVKDPKEVLCGKCLKSPQTASSYCRDCGEFICAMCTTIHSQWSDLAEHEVVAIEKFEEKVKQFDTLKKVTLCCSLHKGMKLDLYCETCEELICLHCTVNKHCMPEHKYNLVVDTFEEHKAEITASLEPIEEQLRVVSKTIEQFDTQLQELDDLQISVETSIQQHIKKLQELLEARKDELIGQVQQFIQMKQKNIAAQKDEVETVHTQLASCLSFVKESLRTGSQGEVMKMKKAVLKQINELTENFKPDMLPPYEPISVRFNPLPDLTQACQQFGKIYLHDTSPEKCYATGKGLKIAELGETAVSILHLVDDKGKASTTPLVEIPTSELVSGITNEKIDCSVQKSSVNNQYEINYQPTHRGRHKLHVKVEGMHIKGSPFPVVVKLPVKKLDTPINTICGLKGPWGVAVNRKGDIIVTERNRHCVSIFSSTGGKLHSFLSCGSGDGLSQSPLGVAICDDGSILVADHGNNRIQKLAPDGKFVAAIGERGDKKLEFVRPCGISIHPHTGKVYIADQGNHRIQILNPDFTFFDCFGGFGGSNGQFNWPSDVACDNNGNVYVADYNNHRIQVFTAEGKFLLKFDMLGIANEKLKLPSSISISIANEVFVTNNHHVSVFTSNGKFLSSFGSKGSEPGQFNQPCGITIDDDGFIYISDTDNARLQIF